MKIKIKESVNKDRFYNEVMNAIDDALNFPETLKSSHQDERSFIKVLDYLEKYSSDPRINGTDFDYEDWEEDVELAYNDIVKARSTGYLKYSTKINKKYLDPANNSSYYDESLKESVDDFTEYKYVGNIRGYQTYRKIVDGKGVWIARHQDSDENNPNSYFEITYDQARGFEDIIDPNNDSSVNKLSRRLGKELLPPAGWNGR